MSMGCSFPEAMVEIDARDGMGKRRSIFSSCVGCALFLKVETCFDRRSCRILVMLFVGVSRVYSPHDGFVHMSSDVVEGSDNVRRLFLNGGIQ